MNQMFSHQNEKPKTRYNINKVNARNIAGSSVLKKFYSTVSMHLQESRDTEMRNPILYDREAENASEELEDRHFWVERINAQKQTPHFLPHGKQEHWQEKTAKEQVGIRINVEEKSMITKNFTLAGRKKKRRWKEDCTPNVLWYCRRCFASAECWKMMEYPQDPATFQARCTFRLALVGRYQYNYQQIEGFSHPIHRISAQQHLYLAANYTRSYQYKLQSETMTNTRNYELFIRGKAFLLNDGTKLLENLYRVMCEDMAFF